MSSTPPPAARPLPALPLNEDVNSGRLGVAGALNEDAAASNDAFVTGDSVAPTDALPPSNAARQGHSDWRSIIVMGVSGCGKSTIAERLALKSQARFIDADSFHPPENVAKMARGEALNDADRAPWLAALRAELDAAEQRDERCVLACSALKQRYRDALGVNPPLRPLVFLEITEMAAARRVATRHRHFMPASLVASQFAALEAPLHALRIDATLPPDTILNRILAALS